MLYLKYKYILYEVLYAVIKYGNLAYTFITYMPQLCHITI